MIAFKCKMCGGDLNPIENASTCQCEFCGTLQTIPNADNEKKTNLFGRAQRLLRACDFDKAAGVFETIVAEFPTEAEAYWGLVLCKYGIEYVDDPNSGKKVPTCHRSSFDSIMDDQNFEQATENADVIARRLYREEAKQIEELRKKIIEVSGKEDPYDIFICYKETDDEGNRTLDSVLAQDIYSALTEKGYKVFFSRISLEDKLGQEYEPFIFAALNSSKVMLAIGTDYEYYNSVWVKNEWSRFLRLIASGQKKTLIPCFKGIDAYDMPKEFAKLQALDLGKIGAMQDLLRGIDKVMLADNANNLSHSSNNTNSNMLRNYLSMANNALNAGNYNEAETYCNKILEIDFNSSEVWEIKGQVALHYKERVLEAANHFNNALKNTENKEECAKRIINECSDIIKSEVGKLVNAWKANTANSQIIIDYIRPIASMYDSLQIDAVSKNEYNEPFAGVVEFAATSVWDNQMKTKLRENQGHTSKASFDTFLRTYEYPINVLEAVCISGTNINNHIQRLNKLISWAESATRISSWHFQTEDEALLQHYPDPAARVGINRAINLRIHPPGWVSDYVMSDECINRLRMKIASWKSRIRSLERELIEFNRMEAKRKLEEKELKEKRITEYWESHSEEKQKLEEKMEQLTKEMEPYQNALLLKQKEVRELKNAAENAVKPLKEKDQDIFNQIKDLENKRAYLGIFKGKERKRITEQIEQLTAQRPSQADINAQRQKVMDEVKPQLDTISQEMVKLQKTVSDLLQQIDDIKAEFTKDR